MFTVLIVEDEMLVSIGLRNMIDWEKMDMKVIAEAQNGEAAFEIYQKEKPDLILTDIKMPVMDGLQLISRIREKDKKTKIIILTCYQEFDMVHQALKLGISDYILKLRMSTDDMESVIKKVHDELASENITRLVNNGMVVNARFIKEKIIKDYIINQAYSDAEFEKMICGMQMRLKSSGLILCMMKVSSNRNSHDKLDAKHENTLRETILNLIDELLDKYKRGEIVYEKDQQYMILFSFGDVAGENDAQTMLYEILDRISIIMKTYINSQVTFGISTRCNHYSALKDLYYEAAMALKQSYFMGDVRCIRYADNSNKSVYLSLIEKFRGHVTGIPDMNNEYRKEIMEGISLLEEMFCVPEEEVQELFIQWIHRPAANSNAFGNDRSNIALEYAGRIRTCTTLIEIMGVFEQYLLDINESQANVRLVGREVSETVRFIKDNYFMDISLQQVADQVEISANYLCSLFKKDLHISVMDYVNRVRIDKAKELLLNTHLKTYQIAQKVGFADESYFSRIFKKITGYRPNEFKKQNAVVVEDLFDKNKV